MALTRGCTLLQTSWPSAPYKLMLHNITHGSPCSHEGAFAGGAPATSMSTCPAVSRQISGPVVA